MGILLIQKMCNVLHSSFHVLYCAETVHSMVICYSNIAYEHSQTIFILFYNRTHFSTKGHVYVNKWKKYSLTPE